MLTTKVLIYKEERKIISYLCGVRIKRSTLTTIIKDNLTVITKSNSQEVSVNHTHRQKQLISSTDHYIKAHKLSVKT